MRKFIFPALFSTAITIAGVYADTGSQAVLSDTETSTTVSSPTSSGLDLPTFTPSNIKAEFIEQFIDGWDKLWKPSHAKKDVKAAENKDEEWAYIGEFSVEEPYVFSGLKGDKGLVLKTPAAHHAISANFDKKIDNTGKTLVVQYEVKLQNGLECGGAYLKLLRDTEALRQEEFSNVSPYVIMFGPDKCGATNKVHVIINHKNPLTGEYEEKHLTSPPAARIVKTTELYTLIIHPNNTGIIKLNGKQVKEFNLLEDFSPAFNPPEKIDDPKDSKPENWVDEARIPDPAAKKPDDWDEDAPFEIVDEEATKPDDWLVDEPLTIPDPSLEKPEDWIDEEDGDWIAPTIPNPKCDNVSGCGPWTKPLTKNPAYKGKWAAPFIDNPAYKGPWSPRKIKNPDFYEDKTPSNLEPIGAIGFEIWTMQNNILFDNIFIGHSLADAEAFADETFHEKHPYEQLLEIEERTKSNPGDSNASNLKFTGDPLSYIRQKLELFINTAKKDPVQAVKSVPEVAGSIVALLLTLTIITLSLFSSNPSAEKKSTNVSKVSASDKKTKENKDEKAPEAVASGVDSDTAESRAK